MSLAEVTALSKSFEEKAETGFSASTLALALATLT